MVDILILAAAVVFCAGSFYLAYRSRSLAESVREEFENFESRFQEVDKANKQLEQIKESYKSLQSEYLETRQQWRANQQIISQFEIGVGTVDEALYKVSHPSDEIDVLESDLIAVKDSLKELVSSKRACVCNMGENVTVNGRKAGAKKLFNREIKLRLRCFDNEVKAAIALANWNNINRLNSRVRRAFNGINERGKMVKTFITHQYLELKLKELNLSFEITQLKELKKEEERERRQLERESEREERKIIEAAKKAKKDRERMEELVKKELAKLSSLSETQREELEMHKQELEALKQREQRAISMAQQTRAGFVYVISNVNSFGEGVLKIGMTRRADPNERVRELGDASVPDTFDVHGFFYCEDAPRLESDIHKTFEDRRVNLVNKRKEFFQVGVDEVIAKIDGHEIETVRVDSV